MKYPRLFPSARKVLRTLRAVRRRAPLYPDVCRWGRTGLLGSLTLAGISAVGGGTPSHALSAQEWPAPTSSLRLTVRPHDMVLGTRNAKAGAQELDTHHDSIYVPPSAVGTRRVPLAVMFSEDIGRFRPMADKFGMIIVTLPADWQEGSAWDAIRNRGRITVMDSALHDVLSHHAIDPNKIALMGLSGGGDLSMIIGCENLDIFSDLGLMSPIPGDEYHSCDVTKRPPAARVPMFLTMGIGEPSAVSADALRTAIQARRDGHPLQLALDLRLHRARRQDSGNAFEWLADNWASPKRVRKPAPLESVVPLTTDILTKMTTFWGSYRDNHPDERPDDMPDIWPAVNVAPTRIPVARDTVTVFDMVDLQAIATKDSTIQSSLNAAGLTFAQERSYRAAFIGARATLVASYKGPELGAIPMVEQNATFLKAHMDDANTLLDLMMGEIRCETSAQEKMMPGSCR